jgi:hypothetical protein
MELNCTYEESKKILELGYDFSPVCDRFIEELTELKRPERIERVYFGVVVFRSEVNQHIKDSWIPIVPYDALAKCLMGFSFHEETEDHSRLLHTYSYRQYPKNIFEAHYPSMETELSPISHLCRIAFSSAYEAFIWGHDKFPKQLKEKFEEVMK